MISRQAIDKITEYFALKLNYRFKNPDLLVQALTRESARGELVAADAKIFESLEFVGDRALNMSVAGELFRLNEDATPGKLSRLYIEYTCNSDSRKRNGGPLYRVAKELDLEIFIIKSPLEDLAIHGSRGKLVNVRVASKYETRKTREGNLSDHVEALIGALYLDSDDGNGSGMVQVVTFVKRFWRHMGLNEDCISESSFGNSVISTTALNVQKQIRLNNIFIASAKLGNWPQALEAYQNGAEIETVDEEQRTALLHFSARGNYAAVAELISSKAYIEHTDINGWTALLHAAANAKFQIFRLLLTEGAVVDIEVISNESRISVPVLAAIKNSNEIIHYITTNYLFSFSDEQFNFAATQALEKNKVHVQSLIQRCLIQKSKCNVLFSAIYELLADSHNPQKMQAVKDAILAGADVRVRNANDETIFHVIGKLDTRIELLSFILKRKPKLDGIILSNIEDNIFQIEEFEQNISNRSSSSIDEIENISFKHGDLTNFDLSTIKKFTNVDFSDAILIGVSFHPEAVFVNTNFKAAHVDETCPPTQHMDITTLLSLPAQWKEKTSPTTVQKFALKEINSHALFSPATAIPATSSSSSTFVASAKSLTG